MICVFAISSILCFSNTAVADLVLADGGPTGQWYNPERDGEGFFVEIIETSAAPQIFVAMFSYDENGDQLWAMGSEDAGECNAEILCAAGVWPIEDGSFACVNTDGDLIVGHFNSFSSASGLAFKERGGKNDYCVASWSASPD